MLCLTDSLHEGWRMVWRRHLAQHPHQWLSKAALRAAARGRLGAALASFSGSGTLSLRRHVQRCIQLAQQLLEVLVAIDVIQACNECVTIGAGPSSMLSAKVYSADRHQKHKNDIHSI
jgi:hypothetical protein